MLRLIYTTSSRRSAVSLFKKICLFVFTAFCLKADELQIAVAANFAEPLNTLARLFERQSGHKITSVVGSTGKFYLQIRHGAPFEVFLAADSRHPRLLDDGGIVVKGTRFTYAIGKIVLWSPKANFIDSDGKILEKSVFDRLALANPDVAPYGQAAREYLIRRNLWDFLQAKLVLGQDLGQTYQFIITGNAELGFVGLSQLQSPRGRISGSFFIVPQKDYPPLEQQAVLIKPTRAGKEFLEFLKSPAAKKIIAGYGYGIP